jgi:hypothetical protein
MITYAYFLLGAVFVTIAIVAHKMGGVRLLAIAAFLTVVLVLAVGLWDWRRQPRVETQIGLPVLLALVPPTVAALAIARLAKAQLSLASQWFFGSLAWVVGFLATWIVALSFDWVTL